MCSCRSAPPQHERPRHLRSHWPRSIQDRSRPAANASLDAVAGARQERLFEVAIAQPAERGYRDRDQQDHRDGQSGGKRHPALCAFPLVPTRGTGHNKLRPFRISGGSNYFRLPWTMTALLPQDKPQPWWPAHSSSSRTSPGLQGHRPQSGFSPRAGFSGSKGITSAASYMFIKTGFWCNRFRPQGCADRAQRVLCTIAGRCTPICTCGITRGGRIERNTVEKWGTQS